MMIGESTLLVPKLVTSHSNLSDSSMRSLPSPVPIDAFSVSFNGNAGGPDYPAFHSFLSNDFTPIDLDSLCEDFDLPFDAFSRDHFRMFEFKIRKCTRSRSHDWTECPYAHPGEKARRRDPRKHHYSGAACPEFRRGNCKKGDSCEFAHGVFECWLHPSRYRTQFCKDGTNCRRRVCFFAHNPDQLRFISNGSGDSLDGLQTCFVSSPTSVLNSSPISSLSDSPPSSPGNHGYGVSEIATSMRNVQIDPRGPHSCGFGSPRGFQIGLGRGSNLRPGFFSAPSTPTRGVIKSGHNPLDTWDQIQSHEEEPAMERVESGRELRAKIYAKLSKENSFCPRNT